MLGYTREKILEYLLLLPGLINQYSGKDPAFFNSSLAWLADLEQELMKLRHPIAGLVAIERGKIIAADDGYNESDIVETSRSKRKRARATVVVALGRVQESLQIVVENTDSKLSAYSEKMAQLIAVATQKDPLPAPIEPREAWLHKVWEFLSQQQESKALFTYLNTALTTTDRNYILQNILEHLL